MLYQNLSAYMLGTNSPSTTLRRWSQAEKVIAFSWRPKQRTSSWRCGSCCLALLGLSNIQYRFHMVSVCDITWQFIIWGLLGFDCFETEIFFWIWRVEGWTSASTQIYFGMLWENILNFAILPTATMANHTLSSSLPLNFVILCHPSFMQMLEFENIVN